MDEWTATESFSIKELILFSKFRFGIHPPFPSTFVRPRVKLHNCATKRSFAKSNPSVDAAQMLGSLDKKAALKISMYSITVAVSVEDAICI